MTVNEAAAVKEAQKQNLSTTMLENWLFPSSK